MRIKFLIIIAVITVMGQSVIEQRAGDGVTDLRVYECVSVCE